MLPPPISPAGDLPEHLGIGQVKDLGSVLGRHSVVADTQDADGMSVHLEAEGAVIPPVDEGDGVLDADVVDEGFCPTLVS